SPARSRPREATATPGRAPPSRTASLGSAKVRVPTAAAPEGPSAAARAPSAAAGAARVDRGVIRPGFLRAKGYGGSAEVRTQLHPHAIATDDEALHGVDGLLHRRERLGRDGARVGAQRVDGAGRQAPREVAAEGRARLA